MRLMSIKGRSEALVETSFVFRNVSGLQASSLSALCDQLANAEDLLLKIAVPPGGRDRSWMIDGSEALLQLYVERVTGGYFGDEVSALLEAAAESYGLDRAPSYSCAAVRRRYRRFLTRRPFSFQIRELIVEKLTPDMNDMDLDDLIFTAAIQLRDSLQRFGSDSEPQPKCIRETTPAR